MLIDKFVNCINLHRKEKFNPSGKICVDKSIIQWYRIEGNWICKGLPHFVAIERKPDNGCKIQNSCFGDSGIMLRLKIVRGLQRDASGVNDLTKPPVDLHKAPNLDYNNNAGTNTVLELTRPWWHTNRVVLADSAFASVRMAAKLNKKPWLHRSGENFYEVLSYGSASKGCAAVQGAICWSIYIC